MNIIGHFFSDKYVSEHGKNNIIIYLLGRFTYPLSLIFVKLRVTPNQITTCSTVLALGAAFALALDVPWGFFVSLWFLSAVLDFCDGTVARITDQVRRSSFRYDHTSDLFKIFLIVLGVAIKYDFLYLWVISSLFIFFFMYYQLLNHDCDFASKMANMHLADVETKNESSKEVRDLSLKKRLKIHLKDSYWLKILMGLYAIFFTINGHSLLLFLLFPLGLNTTLYILIYLTALAIFGVSVQIQNLRQIPKNN